MLFFPHAQRHHYQTPSVTPHPIDHDITPHIPSAYIDSVDIQPMSFEYHCATQSLLLFSHINIEVKEKSPSVDDTIAERNEIFNFYRHFTAGVMLHTSYFTNFLLIFDFISLRRDRISIVIVFTATAPNAAS